MTNALLADTTPADQRRDTAPAGARPVLQAHGSQPSRKALWAGRVMSGLVALFLLFDASLKVLGLLPAEEA